MADLSPGARLVQEWDVPAADILRRMGAAMRAQDHGVIDRLTQEWEASLRDLARRIDAALAEVKEKWTDTITKLNDSQNRHTYDCERLTTALAEREAQIAQRDQRVGNMQLVEADVRAEYLRFEQRALAAEAQSAALHGQLRVGVEFVKNGAPNEHFMEWVRNADRMCAAIDAAARAFVERIQAEERERCANILEAEMPYDAPHRPCLLDAAALRLLLRNWIAAIRALLPRRGT